MEEQGSFLCQLVMKRADWIFVARNAKQMPDQVTQALKTALAINEPAILLLVRKYDFSGIFRF